MKVRLINIVVSIDGGLRYLVLMLLRAYDYILSPWLGGQCRFHPTCSRYARSVFSHCSFWHALKLTVFRLLRCHPFCSGGYDPPPISPSATTTNEDTH